ncbi:MAG: hypothetical protein EXR21_04735 [Flavobacteriaceae bacterium]|nr:hypothetical protein [Flavobacteriaceae bacterium]
MTPSPILLNLISKLADRKMAIGYRLLQFISIETIADEQEIYQKNFAGFDLANTKEGFWQKQWLVFASDELGSPVFVDTEDKMLPVFTATLEDDGWMIYKVANRVEDYFRFVEIISKVAEDRENPDMLSQNPIPEVVSEAIMTEIEKFTTNCEVWYWELFLENYQVERKFDL